MKSLNIVFSRSSNPFAAAIRAYPPSGPYSHCSIFLEEENKIIESLASKFGVIENTVEKLKDRASVLKMLSFSVPEENLIIANEWANSTVGDGYDWSYVFSIPFRVRDWHQEGDWACSEHCAVYIEKAKIPIIAPGLHGLTPMHLYSIMYAAGARERAF